MQAIKGGLTMNKQVIRKTAICYWSKEDECYLMQSPLCEGVLGVGDTAEEAETTFNDLLSDTYEAYLEGRVPGYDKPGRPAKGGVSFDTNIQPSTKECLKEIAAKIGCSMGEAVDYLVFQYNHPEHMQANYPNYDLTNVVAESRRVYKTKDLFSNEQVKFLQAIVRRELNGCQKDTRLVKGPRRKRNRKTR
jgi:predicted RNase H-like HicB family nuclease